MSTRASLAIRSAAVALLGALAFAASQPARALPLVNGSFETDVLASDSFCISFAAPLCAATTGWTGNFYLVSGSPPAIAPLQPLPDGVQFALLQATGGMLQSVTISTPGTYQLTWSDAGRQSFINAAGNESYDVSFGGTLLGSFSTTTGSPWASRSLVFSTTAGVFDLAIAGTTPFGQGDNSALLDNFVLQPFAAPEPGTLALGLSAWLSVRALRRASISRS